MGVMPTSVPPRSNSTTPSSSSSLRMATDKVGWLTKQASAARPKCRSRATATMYLSSVRVISVSRLWSCAGLAAQVVLSVAHPALQMRFGMIGIALAQFLQGFLRLLHYQGIGFQVREAQKCLAGLSHAQEFTWPAQGQVAPGNIETVGCFVHGPQPLARNGR